jgi:hypothetical protein
VTLAPDVLVAQAGGQVGSQLTIERGTHFSGFPVTFALESAPPGISLLAPSPSITGDSAAVTLDVAPTVAPGRYLLSLRGAAQNAAGQDVARVVTIALDVDPGDFYVTLDTPTLSISRSTTCTLQVGAVRTGFADDIDFSSLSLTPGINATFSPPVVSGPAGTGTSWMLTADATAAFGEHDIAVSGRAGARQRSAPLRLAITAARDSCATSAFTPPAQFQDFSISLSTPSVSVPQGEITAVDITIDRSQGFADLVSFSTSGVPAGTLAKFDPAGPTAGNTKRLILLAGPTAEVGTYAITITATGAGQGFTLTHQATLDTTITAGAQLCGPAPVADSYINAGITNGAPGASQVLQVGSADLQQATKTYLAFDTLGIAWPFDKVELVMSLYSNPWAAASPNDTRTIYVWGITDDDDWDVTSLPETALNWSNAPKNDTNSTYHFLGEGTTSADATRHLGSIVVASTDQTRDLYRVDVTDYVRWAIGHDDPAAAFSTLAARDFDGIVTFMLGNFRVSGVGASDYTEFRSREVPTACEQPHLEVFQ